MYEETVTFDVRGHEVECHPCHTTIVRSTVELLDEYGEL